MTFLSMGQNNSSLIVVSLLMGLAGLLKQIAGFIRTKLIAVYAGPVGVGLWGYIQAFVDVCQAFCLLGTDRSAISSIAGEEKDRDKAVVLTSTTLLVVISLLTLTMFSYVAKITGILVVVGWDILNENLLYIVIAINMMTMATVVGVMLNGLGEYKRMALAQSTGAILATMILAVILLEIPTIEVSQLFMIWSVVNLIVYIAIYRQYLYSYRLAWGEILSRMVGILSTGRSYWVAQLFTLGVLYAVNQAVLSKSGDLSLGHFVAAWATTNIFISLMLNSLVAGYFPKITKLVSFGKPIDEVVNWQVGYGLLVASVAVVFLSAFPHEVLSILYTEEFTEAATAMMIFAVSSCLRFLGFPFGYALLAYGRGDWYLYSQAIFNTVYLSLVFVVLRYSHWSDIPYAYMASYFLYVVLLLTLLNSISRIRLDKQVYIYISVLMLVVLLIRVVENSVYYNSYVVKGVLVFLYIAFVVWQLWKNYGVNVIAKLIGRMVK